MKIRNGITFALLAGSMCSSALAVEVSSFCKAQVPGSYILPSDEDSWIWGMAPIYDEAGKLHIFNSVIPIKAYG